MRIGLFTLYAILVLHHVSHCKTTTTISQLAKEYGISRNHLVKVAHALGKLGFISTARGRGGGIRPIFGADEIRLGKLLCVLEDAEVFPKVIRGLWRSKTAFDVGRLEEILQESRLEMLEFLDGYSIEDLSRSS